MSMQVVQFTEPEICEILQAFRINDHLGAIPGPTCTVANFVRLIVRDFCENERTLDLAPIDPDCPEFNPWRAKPERVMEVFDCAKALGL